jgi:hypothetical protein
MLIADSIVPDHLATSRHRGCDEEIDSLERGGEGFNQLGPPSMGGGVVLTGYLLCSFESEAHLGPVGLSSQSEGPVHGRCLKASQLCHLPPRDKEWIIDLDCLEP